MAPLLTCCAEVVASRQLLTGAAYCAPAKDCKACTSKPSCTLLRWWLAGCLASGAGFLGPSLPVRVPLCLSLVALPTLCVVSAHWALVRLMAVVGGVCVRVPVVAGLGAVTGVHPSLVQLILGSITVDVPPPPLQRTP